ncbi:MAG TPA: sulfotransferase family 2 domain-containing protein [Xanthobacteraceae bacterium]|nr:sulfotransferase family 2 domain-containing protein [Xanthobacteraceae bacterium]
MPADITIYHVTGYAGLTPKQDLRGHTLIFTHVPKTAGTSLDYILIALAGARKIPFYRAMGTIYGQYHGAGKKESWKDFERWPETALAQRQCFISGHLPHGAHRRVKRPYFYVTMLRDPVSRLVSQFRFGVQRGGWTESTPMAEVIERGGIANDLQTRQIAGIMDLTTPCNADSLKQAIEHLRSEYTVVGLSSGFDETVKVLITLLGWPEIAYGNRQVSEGKPSAQIVEQAEQAAKRYFANDLELYAAAKEIAAGTTARLFDGTASGMQRQPQVLVTVPGLRLGGKDAGIMPRDYFESNLRPSLQQQGVKFSTV